MTTERAPLHVLIADSAQLRSQLIAHALGRRADFRVSKCTLETSAIAAALQGEQVDTVLADFENLNSSQPELDHIRQVHLAYSRVPLVLLVSTYDRDLVVQAFRMGVRGLFCFANGDFRALCKCLHCVHRGQIWASSEQLGMLLESMGHAPGLRVSSVTGKSLLSPREEQVVALVADGMSNRAVAVQLRLSENTIKKYLFRIFEKLGVSSRVELVLYAMKSGDPHQAA